MIPIIMTVIAYVCLFILGHDLAVRFADLYDRVKMTRLVKQSVRLTAHTMTRQQMIDVCSYYGLAHDNSAGRARLFEVIAQI